MVIMPAAHAAVTPAGKPVTAPMPVAPVVVKVMFDMAALIQVKTGADVVTVLSGVTKMVPVAAKVPQPPVNGMV